MRGLWSPEGGSPTSGWGQRVALRRGTSLGIRSRAELSVWEWDGDFKNTLLFPPGSPKRSLMPGGHTSNALSEGSSGSREGPAYTHRHLLGPPQRALPLISVPVGEGRAGRARKGVWMLRESLDLCGVTASPQRSPSPSPEDPRRRSGPWLVPTPRASAAGTGPPASGYRPAHPSRPQFPPLHSRQRLPSSVCPSVPLSPLGTAQIHCADWKNSPDPRL